MKNHALRSKKKLLFLFVSVLLLLSALTLVTLAADPPDSEYWPKQSAYTKAKESGNNAEIARTAEDILKLYKNRDSTLSCNRSVGPAQDAAKAYEALGKIDDAIRCYKIRQDCYAYLGNETAVSGTNDAICSLIGKYGTKAEKLSRYDAVIAQWKGKNTQTAHNCIQTAAYQAGKLCADSGDWKKACAYYETRRVSMQRLYDLAAADKKAYYDEMTYFIEQEIYNLTLANGSDAEVIAACETIFSRYLPIKTETAARRVMTPALEAAHRCEKAHDAPGALRYYTINRDSNVWLNDNTDENRTEAIRYMDAMLLQYSMTEPVIYASAENPADVPYYGAKGEPVVGVHNGMCGETMDRSLSDSFLLYVQFESETVRSFDWRLPKDGKPYTLEVAWNFSDETSAKTDRAMSVFGKVSSGGYDASVIEDLKYLNTLKDCTVLLRFGAEVNVWNAIPSDPKQIAAFEKAFIDAFRHFSALVKKYAPNAAVVFSPNDVSNMNVTISDFYPGDEWVDWVGMSSYMNRSADAAGEYGSLNDAYYKHGVYENQLLKVKEIVDLFGGRKPIMISECGFAYKDAKGLQTPEFASEKLHYFYSYVNMLFPQVKAVFYFNSNYEGAASGTCYRIFGEKADKNVAAVYTDTVRANAPISGTVSGTPEGYTRIETLNEKRDSLSVSVFAYLPGVNEMTVVYSFDGKKQTAKTVPYTLNLDKASLTEGRHTLSVTVTSGKTNYYYDYVIYVRSDGNVRVTKPDLLDIEPRNWAFPYAAYCVQEGFFDGLASEIFDPLSTVTRGMFVTLLGRAAGADPDAYALPDFKDVPKDAYYAKYVSWAKEAGVTQGTGDGTTFSPDAVITREQICTMLLRYCQSTLGLTMDTGADTLFKDDAVISSWAHDAVYALRNAGIINGKGDNTFDPLGILTRQEIAVILKNFHLNFIRQ